VVRYRIKGRAKIKIPGRLKVSSRSLVFDPVGDVSQVRLRVLPPSLPFFLPSSLPPSFCHSSFSFKIWTASFFVTLVLFSHSPPSLLPTNHSSLPPSLPPPLPPISPSSASPTNTCRGSCATPPAEPKPSNSPPSPLFLPPPPLSPPRLPPLPPWTGSSSSPVRVSAR